MLMLEDSPLTASRVSSEIHSLMLRTWADDRMEGRCMRDLHNRYRAMLEVEDDSLPLNEVGVSVRMDVFLAMNKPQTKPHECNKRQTSDDASYNRSNRCTRIFGVVI